MKSVILKDKRIIGSLIWRSLKWHLNYFFTRRPLPLACGLYITSRCNLKCAFCNIWRKSPVGTLSWDEAKNLVDSLSRLGCFYFSITGGEPLLVDYIFDILTYARRTKIRYIHMVTNGSLLDMERAKRLGETGINEVSISIDGSEQFHDKKRGLAGSYRGAVGAIENMKRYAPGVRIVLNAIFSPQEPFECLHTVELARRFGVYVKVQPLNQHPLFNKDNYSVTSSEQTSAPEIKAAVEKLYNEGGVINSKAFLVNLYNFFCQKEALIFRDSACLFGYHHIEILEDGSIFPCLEGLNWEKGMNIESDLRNLIHSQGYKRLLEGLKGCRGCQRNYYICYYEPRINFPINNFLRSVLYRNEDTLCQISH